ncbi:hypothetical protein [Tsukamurella sp. PLM1]|uniref:hypothetical protein n=1 Tax=Tsukamurella sp. PLM1 TaxID=2929795 RepID=UPI002058A484|nr:hypothetical protein MTP03_00420 [Tsukamurella sp. PLM1]
MLVPLPGHTLGHTAVAVDAGERWILHCGDAFYHRSAVEGDAAVPLATRAFERMVATDYTRVKRNQERIRALQAQNDPDLLIVCAHDPGLLARAQRSA